MLAQRVVTAVVLLLVLAGAAALGSGAFLALAAAIIGLACFEWLRLACETAPELVADHVARDPRDKCRQPLGIAELPAAEPCNHGDQYILTDVVGIR